MIPHSMSPIKDWLALSRMVFTGTLKSGVLKPTRNGPTQLWITHITSHKVILLFGPRDVGLGVKDSIVRWEVRKLPFFVIFLLCLRKHCWELWRNMDFYRLDVFLPLELWYFCLFRRQCTKLQNKLWTRRTGRTMRRNNWANCLKIYTRYSIADNSHELLYVYRLL